MRSYHDLGGLPAGPVDRKEPPLTLFEKHSDALLTLLWRKKVLTIDENRRAVETLGAEVYESVSYDERRVMAIANNLILKGIIAVDELAAKLVEIERRAAPRP